MRTIALLFPLLALGCGSGGSNSKSFIQPVSNPPPTQPPPVDEPIPPSFTIDQWKWRSPAPQGNSLWDVAYGNGAAIAVGAGGTIYHLSEGLKESGTFLPLWSIAFGNGTFVAVGAGNAILTSQTGSTWKWQTDLDPEAGGYVGVAFGNNVFVAISSNRIYTSPDNGMTWTMREFPSHYFSQVLFGDQFIVVSDSAEFFTSPDGVTWTEGSIPNEKLLVIGHGQGKYVAISDWTNKVYTSPDAVTWTAVGGNPLFDIMSIAGGNGVFVAVGRDNGGVVSRSTDGITWTASKDISALDLLKVDFFDGQFVAVGAGGLIVTSPDGETWTDTTSRVSTLPFVSVAYGNDLFIAAGQYFSNHAMFSSHDGVTWTELPPLPNNVGAHRVKYMDRLFYAFSEESIFSTLDGVNWTTMISVPNAYFNDLIYANNMYIAVGPNESKILTSPDGVTWTERWTGPEYFGFTGIAFGNNIFVAVGSLSNIVTSQDGFTWSTANLNNARDDFRSVAFGKGQFVAVGREGSAYSSSDGMNWQNRVFDDDHHSFSDVIFTQDGFVAVGYVLVGVGPLTYAHVHTSLDGIIWADQILAAETNLLGITYGAGHYTVVGWFGTILQSDTVTFHPGSP